jgi:hypothetical protein
LKTVLGALWGETLLFDGRDRSGVYFDSRGQNLSTEKNIALAGRQRFEVKFVARGGLRESQPRPGWSNASPRHTSLCVFRRSRSPFRDDADRHSGMMAITVGAKRRWLLS